MEITFTLADIESVKRELARLLPNVKSSHRAEAMARGLGWNTNAALRADLAARAIDRRPDQQAFETYLGDHGFAQVPPDLLLHAVTRAKSSSSSGTVPQTSHSRRARRHL